jgi:signal transduction histidine kinase
MGIEILLDGAMLFLASLLVFEERFRLRLRDGLLCLVFFITCLFSRGTIVLDTSGYELIPAGQIELFFMLVFLVMIINSLWFRKNGVFTLFGTFAVFSLFILLRQVSVVLFYGLDLNGLPWYPIVLRIFSILLLIALSFTPIFKWLIEKLDDGSYPVMLLIGNTAVFLFSLLIYYNFSALQMTENLPLIIVLLSVLAIADLVIGLYTQKRFNERKRIRMLEQYVPVIEELMSQVRARKHEFNNRLFAISAAVETAETLDQAKAEIAELTKGMQIGISEKSLLGSDSKITAGMIYGKTKLAEMNRVNLVSEINASLKVKSIREVDLVEIIGILLDNAIEASVAGDTIYIKVERQDDELSIAVSNPHDALSATDFVRMFRRGYSTKTKSLGSRGYGLANVKDIVNRYHGKLLTKNETISERNYVTIGVLLH